jgi:hypothetical protein
MGDDLTPVMGETERQHCRQLSLQTLRPPLRVPGYEQESFLGRGSFGEVWVALDSNSGRKVAIKFYHRRGGLDWSLLSREVEKLRHLFSDRYVVQLLAVGWDSDPPYYVMEYMERGSLEERLGGGPLPVAEALTLARDVAVGLVHAHGKGILHCDLKPANIMLDQDGKPRLADFGQSRLTHEHSPALGTLFYMAPEQADLKAVPDARWDVYALGALLYQMLTGEPPHRSAAGAADVQKPGRLEERLERYRAFLRQVPRPAAHRAVTGVDRALADIIDRCLAVNPAQRYPNVQAVLNALDARSLRRAQRPLLVLGTVGPALVVLVMALIAGWLFRSVVATAEREVIDRALESDGFAARSVARRFALQVEKRWGILEQEAADPNLRRLLGEGAKLERDPKACTELDRWINDRHASWDRRFTPDSRASLWAVYDRAGYQRACSPTDDRFLHKYFGYRDYFHGLGFNLAEGRRAPKPIARPHRSVVYRRKGNNAWTVAFSVPVPGLDLRDSEPIGVLAMATDLGGSTRFEWTRKQFAVLIDTRADETGKRGLIVEHPYLNQLSHKPDAEFRLYYSPEVVARAQQPPAVSEGREEPQAAGPASWHDYTDPVGGDFRGSWLATAEPVVVPSAGADVRDTGWVILVQERVADTVAPLRALTTRLIVGGVVALALVVAVVTVLWGFVLFVLNALPQSRLTTFLRRRVGMPSTGPSGASGLSGSGGRSGSAGTPGTPGPARGLPAGEASSRLRPA